MFPYANTNIELFNQLSRDRYSAEDLGLIVKTYELAKSLFAGWVLAYGRDYFSHVVRTASILAFHHAPLPVVAAGLIHNSYSKGDFGFGKKGISNAKRRLVRNTLGKEVDECIAGFAAMKWNETTFPFIRDALETSDRTFRHVVLLYLAEGLEHNLDYGVLYTNESTRKRWILKRNHPLVVEIAEKLGYPALAKELSCVFQENAKADLPEEAWKEKMLSHSFCIIPHSCRKRLSIVVYETFANLKKRLRHRFALRLLS